MKENKDIRVEMVPRFKNAIDFAIGKRKEHPIIARELLAEKSTPMSIDKAQRYIIISKGEFLLSVGKEKAKMKDYKENFEGGDWKIIVIPEETWYSLKALSNLSYYVIKGLVRHDFE
jgi:hypothetical protein